MIINNEDEDPYRNIIYKNCVNNKKSCFANLMGFLDYYDRLYSRKFQMIDNTFCNYLLGFFAWIFNRKQGCLHFIIVPILTFMMPESILTPLGIIPGGNKLETTGFKLKLSLFMGLYNVFWGVIVIIIVSISIKDVIGRDRPSRVKSVKRILNMRDREGTMKAMPSGDANAVAFFCGVYAYIFGFPWCLIICLPLTCLGRVYVFCHWFGDVIIGAIIGSIGVYLTMDLYFKPLAFPLMKFITGFEEE